MMQIGSMMLARVAVAVLVGGLPVTGFAAQSGKLETPRVLLVPQQDTTLVAQIGTQIRNIYASLGSGFKKGDTLVRFDCAQLDARRGIAKAELVSTQTNLSAKKRLKALKAAGEVEVAMAQATVQKAQAELKLASVQIQQCRVRAPYDGRVVKRHVSQYQGVKVGDPLLDIVATGALKLRLNVPSRWLAWLKVGREFTISVDETGKQYPAKVHALNARVDAVSQSIEIEGMVLGKHQDLLAGMSGTARFENPPAKAASTAGTGKKK